MKHYTHYLEVIIHPSGLIEYASPSHQGKLLQFASNVFGVDKPEIEDWTPRSYYFEYIQWLCKLTSCIAVWETFYQGEVITNKQGLALHELASYDLYTGQLPDIENFL